MVVGLLEFKGCIWEADVAIGFLVWDDGEGKVQHMPIFFLSSNQLLLCG